MNHWHIQEQLVRERHADYAREVARDRRFRPSRRERPDRGVGGRARSLVAAAVAWIRARRGALAADTPPGAACGLPDARPMVWSGAWEPIDAADPSAVGRPHDPREAVAAVR